MAGPHDRKRSMGGRSKMPLKRQKREKRVQKEYHSSSSEDEEGQDPKQQQQPQQKHKGKKKVVVEEQEEQEEQDFDAVNLLDSEDDIHDAKVDAVGDDEEDDDLSGQENNNNDDDDDDEEEEEEEDDDDDEFDLGDSDENDTDTENTTKDASSTSASDSKRLKKRNDPAAFATSLSKILATKLSSSRRADPVLARSAAAHETSRAVLDSALEARARRQMREQKRRAQEKGRVRDVLGTAATNIKIDTDTEPISTASLVAAEARLRKVAQRGVVRMFNAVRAAQVSAAEAERDARAAGVLGIARREDKVSEMSKKGFLDLLAAGGGGLKKGRIEEA